MNAQSLNKYTYVYNNPLRYADPSGHQGCDDGEDCENEPTLPAGDEALDAIRIVVRATEAAETIRGIQEARGAEMGPCLLMVDHDSVS